MVLKQFKSFSHIRFDLTRAHGEPKQLAFIYGENGSGKSNLISALLFLLQSFCTMENQHKIKEIIAANRNLIDSIADEKYKESFLRQFLRQRFTTLSELIEDYKMIGSKKKTMSLEFAFRLEGTDGSYYMEFSEQGIIKEELQYQINERRGAIFTISEDKSWLSPSIFINANYHKELQESIAKYWGKHTFIALLHNEFKVKNHEYLLSSISKNIFAVMAWFDQISVWSKQSKHETAIISFSRKFMQQLEQGFVKSPDNEDLKHCEAALNLFFTQLYTDVKSVFYRLSPAEGKYSYELFFKKQIDGKLLDIPFSLESTGSKKLLEVFPLLFAGVEGASVFIDELDSGIHDLLMKDILEQLNESLQGQFIATTHNTLLLENLSPENTYIFRLDSNGNKTIDCVAAYEERTQKTNNMRTKYLRGDYEGIPYIGYLDFDDIADLIIADKQDQSDTKMDGEDN